jgi:hypothetical protein
LSSCGLRASEKNEAGGGKGGGNDGGGKTLRVSPPPWKSLRDSHIPTASTTARLFLKFNPRKELSSATGSGFLQAHSSIRKDCKWVVVRTLPVSAKKSNRTVLRKGNRVARLAVNHKRNVSVNVHLSEKDLQEFESAAKKLWPGAIVSRSSLLLSFARLGLEVARAPANAFHGFLQSRMGLRSEARP